MVDQEQNRTVTGNSYQIDMSFGGESQLFHGTFESSFRLMSRIVV